MDGLIPFLSIEPKGVATTSAGSPIRPVVKVQLPIRTGLQSSTGVTLAPKPGSVVVTAAQPSALTRLIVPISKPQLTPTKGQAAKPKQVNCNVEYTCIAVLDTW